MRIWLSPQEIADAAAAGQMPGLPTTKRNINKLAERENWTGRGLARLRGGRIGGGGLEYHVNALPMAARIAWLKAQFSAGPEIVRAQTGRADAVEARLALLAIAKRFQKSVGESQRATDTLFCELFAAGAIDLPDWAVDHVRGVSVRTLARWRKGMKAGAIQAVGRPKKSGILERAEGGAVRDLILGAMVKHMLVTAKQVRALVAGRYPNGLTLVDEDTGEWTTVPVPSLRSFERAIRMWKVEDRNVLLKLTNPDKFRSLVEVSATGSQRADRLNEKWQIDASPADIMLLVDGKPVRQTVYVAIDVFSRRKIILTTPTPRADGVSLLIRKCILKWGVPEIIHTDNGSDFTAKATKKLLAALGIEIELSPPYQPQTKGIVERAIGTFQRHLRSFPGFVGHSVADRKIIESRKAFSERLKSDELAFFGVELSPEQFQIECDKYAETTYEMEKHGGLKGITPFEKAASYKGTVRYIEDEAALNVLLAPPANGGGLRKVGKQGVKIDHIEYMSMGPQVGATVFVRMDPQDAGRIMMFDPETDAFLGEGWNANLMGIDPVKVAAMSKNLQKGDIADKAGPIRKAARSIGSLEIANALHAEGLAKKATLVAFPQRSEGYSTPALEGAAQAAGTAKSKSPAKSSVSDTDRVAFLEAFKTRSEAPKPRKETDRDRFNRACRIEEDIANGHEVYESDRNWLRSYQQESEYKSWCEVMNHKPVTA